LTARKKTHHKRAGAEEKEKRNNQDQEDQSHCLSKNPAWEASLNNGGKARGAGKRLLGSRCLLLGSRRPAPSQGPPPGLCDWIVIWIDRYKELLEYIPTYLGKRSKTRHRRRSPRGEKGLSGNGPAFVGKGEEGGRQRYEVDVGEVTTSREQGGKKREKGFLNVAGALGSSPSGVYHWDGYLRGGKPGRESMGRQLGRILARRGEENS